MDGWMGGWRPLGVMRMSNLEEAIMKFISMVDDPEKAAAQLSIMPERILE